MPSHRASRRAWACAAPFGLPDQPGRAEQRITDDDGDAGQQAERAQPVEPASGIGACLDMDALKDGAERDPLRQRGDARAERERDVPQRPVTRIAPAELERDAAEDQPEQHCDDQRVGRRQDDRIGEREGGEQAAAAHHQPGLVAVPDRRDRVHRLVALVADREAREEDADAEIEAVHDDIGEDREADDPGPDDGEIDAAHRRYSAAGIASPTAGAGVMPAARCGMWGGSGSPGSGGLAIRRSRYIVPAPNAKK